MDCNCKCHSNGCPKVTVSTVGFGAAPSMPATVSLGYTCANCGGFLSYGNTGAAHQCFQTISFGTAGA